jgi:hypothetical protein
LSIEKEQVGVTRVQRTGVLASGDVLLAGRLETSRAAFLFLSHRPSRLSMSRFDRLRGQTEGLGQTYWLFHGQEGPVPLPIRKRPHHVFTDASLAALGFAWIGPRLVPGHTHMPILEFHREHPEFSHYWLIEQDVVFTGHWRDFFAACARSSADFLTCHVRAYADEPDWPRWDLAHPHQEVPLHERLRSFNPICRFSNRALQCVDRCHADRWRGHHEVLLPTLIYRHGLSVAELGGRGPFTELELVTRFYMDAPPNPQGKMTTGSMRHRPSLYPWQLREPDRLYHPVKPVIHTLKKALVKRLKSIRQSIR